MLEGQTITFTLTGEETFTYTVVAPATSTDESTHLFAGVLHDSDMGEQPVVGYSSITVRAAPPPTPPPVTPKYNANRRFSEPWVRPGTELTVTITATGYGGLDQVVETLPAGFSFVSSSLPDASIVEGQTVIFTLLGNDAFTYTVTASAQQGAYSFAGVLRDSDKVEQPVGGSSELTVSAPPSYANNHTSSNAHANHRARAGIDLKQNGSVDLAKPNASALIGAGAHTHALTDGGASELPRPARSPCQLRRLPRHLLPQPRHRLCLRDLVTEEADGYG